MILFLDLDDTLISSNAAYKKGLSAVGIHFQDPTYLQARAHARETLEATYPAIRSRFLFFKTYLEIKNEYKPGRHLEMIQAFEETVVEHMKGQWRNLGRDNLMTKLLEKFEKIFLVTTETTRMQVLKLNVFDPEMKYFSDLVTGEEVGVDKPNRKVFETAVKRARTSPQNVLVVGDTYETDIVGAQALGMKAIKTIEFKDDGVTGDFMTIAKLDHLLDVV